MGIEWRSDDARRRKAESSGESGFVGRLGMRESVNGSRQVHGSLGR